MPAAEITSAMSGQYRSFPKPNALKCSRNKKTTQSSALCFLLCLKGWVCLRGIGSKFLMTDVKSGPP